MATTLTNPTAPSVAPVGVVAFVIYPKALHHLPDETLSPVVRVLVQRRLGHTDFSAGASQ